MILKQLCIFVENKTGRLYEITKIIASCNINLRALCVADTADFGILRFIVDNPSEALAKLEDAGLCVKTNNMLVVKMADHSGSLSEILEVLARNDIGISYLYAFLSAEQHNTAYVALRIESKNDITDYDTSEEEQKAIKLLKASGYTGSGFISQI